MVADGKIIYSGATHTAKKLCEMLNGEFVDLGGRVVLPGFVDSHMHLDELGMYLNMVDLRGIKSIEELKRKIKEYAKKAETTWILGHGWDHEIFKERRWPTRWDIDEVVEDKPVMLSRVCLHAAVLNTKALEIIGLIDADLPGLMRNDSGEITGVVKEETFEIAREKFKEELALDDYRKFISDAMQYSVSQGVTTVGFVSCDEKSLQALMDLEGKPIRVRVYLDPGKREPGNMYGNTDILDALKKLGIRRGFGDDMIKINGVKILCDGSLGARTAWLSEPYADDPTTSGYPNIDKETLRRIVKEAHEAGLQLSLHGIGDRTIDMILDVYENLEGIKERRHRIEHASILREDQIERMASLGIVAAVQPHFVITDWWAKNRVGKRRARWIYPFKSMLKKGVDIGFSTDSPVEVLNPWETVYAAVTRGKYEKVSHYEDTKHESLSLEEALYAYTQGSSYILFEDKNIGTLEEGKLADFVIVDKDPFLVEERELRNIEVLETYVNGVVVFKKEK